MGNTAVWQPSSENVSTIESWIWKVARFSSKCYLRLMCCAAWTRSCVCLSGDSRKFWLGVAKVGHRVRVGWPSHPWMNSMWYAVQPIQRWFIIPNAQIMLVSIVMFVRKLNPWRGVWGHPPPEDFFVFLTCNLSILVHSGEDNKGKSQYLFQFRWIVKLARQHNLLAARCLTTAQRDGWPLAFDQISC